MTTAVIYGCSGTKLTPDEARFFREAAPWGFILFRRNIETADQTRALCAALRETVGWDAPILIDHEGGRVDRMTPQIVPQTRIPAGVIGDLVNQKGLEAACEAARVHGQLLAQDAVALGLSVNCVPMIDVRAPGSHDIIGDRAFSEDPEIVTALGRAQMQGTLLGGCLPIIKHIPGHGRAKSDSHLDLPIVDAARDDLQAIDFAPFKALSDAPMAMTAHVVYTALDEKACATLSKTVIDNVIRGHIAFDGLLMTDDLSMKALAGGFDERTRASLAAGCDLILHCNGDMEEMTAVASAVPTLEGRAKRRADAAVATPKGSATEIAIAELEAQLASLTNSASLS